MNKMTTAIAVALCVAGFAGAASLTAAEARDAQTATSAQPPFRAYGINRPLDYRFPVTPRNQSFVNRHHRHAWRHRQRYFRPLPALAGPMVIYQNGEIGIPPEEDVTSAIPGQIAYPIVHRLGESGGCGLQQVSVPGSQGRTTVNIWRC